MDHSEERKGRDVHSLSSLNLSSSVALPSLRGGIATLERDKQSVRDVASLLLMEVSL